MTTHRKKYSVLFVIASVFSLLFMVPFLGISAAHAESYDFVYKHLSEKARSGVQLNPQELEVLADPYRAPGFAHLSMSEKALLADRTKAVTVTADSLTGKILSVTPSIPEFGVTTSAVASKGCSSRSRNVCWQTGRIPYADWSFSGTGVVRGYWQYRSKLFTGAHSVTDVCWSGTCMRDVLLNDVTFTWNTLVTGTSIRILS